jgi:mannose-6-phosphate isomerase-like protein (cupin superfamily)
MRPGTYRVRFSGPTVITFEREAVVRAGQTADLDIMLNPAPEAPEPEPAPPQQVPAAAPHGPRGEPKLQSILDLLEKEFIGRQPRKETLLGCSVNLRATMIQLNEQQPERLYENAESAYYVLGGEGTIRLNGRESPLVTGGFALIPRGTTHAFVRKGKRPLILLSVLSGEACEATP